MDLDRVARKLIGADDASEVDRLKKKLEELKQEVYSALREIIDLSKKRYDSNYPLKRQIEDLEKDYMRDKLGKSFEYVLFSVEKIFKLIKYEDENSGLE